MTIKWVPTGGKRYYVSEIQGGVINPTSGITASHRHSSTYVVADRDWMHRDVAVFQPFSGLSSRICKQRAEEMARELNRREGA